MKPSFDNREARIGARGLFPALQELVIEPVKVSRKPLNVAIGRVKGYRSVRETTRDA